MNKYLLGLGALAVLVLVLLLLSGNSTDYVAAIDDEVTQLEEELVEIEAAVEAGTMTPQEAAQAQVRIAQRIEAINTAVDSAQGASLTEAQRAQLLRGLSRLVGILSEYQDTLAQVDEAVMELPEEQRPQLNRSGGRGGSTNSITDLLSDVVDSVEEFAEEIAEEIMPEENATTSEAMSTSTNEETSTDTTDDTSPAEQADDDGQAVDNGSSMETEEPQDDASIEVEGNTNFSFGSEDGESTSTQDDMRQ